MNFPPLGGFSQSAHTMMNRTIDFDKASEKDVRQQLLVGMVELTVRVAYIEKNLTTIRWMVAANSVMVGMAVILSSIALFS